jgi:hypothetical protein
VSTRPTSAGCACELELVALRREVTEGWSPKFDRQPGQHAARATGVPVAVEISRSGHGAHVWSFFTEPVPALDARALGFGLLREAMAVRGELGIDSYDRFFRPRTISRSRVRVWAT